MKKKRWIIPISIIVVLVGILFYIRHLQYSLLWDYGCEKICEYDVKLGNCAKIDVRANCSFKTFMKSDFYSEKMFLWFGIDTRSLKEEPEKPSLVVSDPVR